MKKRIVLLLMLVITGLTANAEGMVYDPMEFNSNVIGDISSESKENTAAQNTISGQSINFQNALYELDSAQVNVRNQLLEYQSKYQEIDTQYKLIKEQRRDLAQQIRTINRKVNAIEKSKNQIRKTMT